MSEFAVKQPPSLYDYSLDELSAHADTDDALPGRTDQFSRYYSDESFWRKVEKFGRMAGAKAVYQAVLLWYVATKKSTPLPIKMLIFGGLGYFVLPIDSVPDFLVGIGYADDIAILFGIISAYGMYMDDASKAKARAKVREIFGNDVNV
jgi:uncharacterized membrane protein YkvA (DUF1232 family)